MSHYMGIGNLTQSGHGIVRAAGEDGDAMTMARP